MTRRTVPLSPLTRIPARRTAVDSILDEPPTIDVEVVRDDMLAHYAPPIGWVPVSPYEPTPIFDALEAEWQWRTVKGRKSRLDLSFDGFVAASRAQHGTYRRGAS